MLSVRVRKQYFSQSFGQPIQKPSNHHVATTRSLRQAFGARPMSCMQRASAIPRWNLRMSMQYVNVKSLRKKKDGPMVQDSSIYIYYILYIPNKCNILPKKYIYIYYILYIYIIFYIIFILIPKIYLFCYLTSAVQCVTYPKWTEQKTVHLTSNCLVISANNSNVPNPHRA